MIVKIIQKAKSGKKQRKYGRNANYCKMYAITHRRERNKLKQLKKHIARFVNDACAKIAADRCKIILGM